jgi:aldehyde dehydrogenase (NAD+)/phenylacetaldehyde dehydrogenase
MIRIQNQARAALSGETFPTFNPATGALLAELPRGRREDVDLAVHAARGAFDRWARLDPYERERLLRRVAELLVQHNDELAAIESRDTGKPLVNARTIDVPRTADTFFYFAGWPTKLTGRTFPVRGPFATSTLREPLGVVGAIVPWNFPLLIAARKVAAALAVGNTVVLKPPEEASLSCIELVRIMEEAGLPPGVVSVVTGLGEEAGAALVDHPDVAKISFTGGTQTGRLIMRNAAASLKRVSLELGGKSPNIIFADADLLAAARAAAPACFYNQGELCTAGTRLLVEKSVAEEVIAQVVDAAKAMKVGDPEAKGTQIGPLISAEHRDRVVGYIQRAQEEGARLRTGGPVDGPGYFVAPTVFDEVRPEMTIAQEEVFGPVLAVLTFETVEEAIALANHSEFGLAAGVWTKDVSKAHHMAQRLQSGTVWVNTYNRFDAAAPYGGVKQSGFGRENGEAVLDEMSQLKTVWIGL